MSLPSLAPALLALVCLMACGSAQRSAVPGSGSDTSILNLAHLDHLGQEVERSGVRYRFVHIYAGAPGYQWVGDADEGIACVDDAARAAIVYLRHFELNGSEASRRKAEGLLRFVMYMQADNGLFYNFILDDALTINRTRQNSRADSLSWWSARAVWALGTGARVLKLADPALAERATASVRRVLPHVRELLRHYGETSVVGGQTLPRWLVSTYAADATSELLLGLLAFEEAEPNTEVRALIEHLAEGVALMQYGSMSTFPYGAHASWKGVWHAWGNAQTQALAGTRRWRSAVREAEQFYPRLLVDGWRHAMDLETPGEVQVFDQIAYDVRPVAVGLIRLYERTHDVRYAQMAGLAASWFTGDNAAGVAMYDPRHGYGYDGIRGPDSFNENAGAESTIEALMTILEVERYPEARRWLHARGAESVHVEKDGKRFAYRVFTSGPGEGRRLAVVMNLTDEHLDLLVGDRLNSFLR